MLHCMVRPMPPLAWLWIYVPLVVFIPQQENRKEYFLFQCQIFHAFGSADSRVKKAVFQNYSYLAASSSACLGKPLLNLSNACSEGSFQDINMIFIATSN